MQSSTITPAHGLNERLRHSKALIPTMAVMLVAVAALATALVVTRTGAQDGPGVPVASHATAPLAASGGTQAPAAYTAQQPAAPATYAQSAALGAYPQPVAPAVQQLAAAGAVSQGAARGPAYQGSAQGYSEPQPVNRQPPVDQVTAPGIAQPQPAACRNCGVVESVTPVERRAPVKGIAGTPVTAGAVAGGVIGGLLGNQVGGGSGRTAATVLGAAGGAYAGNAVQKNMNKYTAYQMRVRMNDGSIRTFEKPSALAAGSRVVVQGNTVRPV